MHTFKGVSELESDRCDVCTAYRIKLCGLKGISLELFYLFYSSL